MHVLCRNNWEGSDDGWMFAGSGNTMAETRSRLDHRSPSAICPLDSSCPLVTVSHLVIRPLISVACLQSDDPTASEISYSVWNFDDMFLLTGWALDLFNLASLLAALPWCITAHWQNESITNSWSLFAKILHSKWRQNKAHLLPINPYVSLNLQQKWTKIH